MDSVRGAHRVLVASAAGGSWPTSTSEKPPRSAHSVCRYRMERLRDTLSRLGDVIDRMQPTTITFLGDLFHAREAHAVAYTGGAISSGVSVMHCSISFWWKVTTIAKQVLRRHRCASTANPIRGASVALHSVITRTSCTTPRHWQGTFILRFACMGVPRPASGYRASGCGTD